MILAICALGAANIAMLILLDRLSHLMLEERKSWQLERANLLQRIQAPERAVVEHSVAQVTEPQMDHPMTDESLARAEEMIRAAEAEFEARQL